MTKLKNIKYRVAPFTTVHIEFVELCNGYSIFILKVFLKKGNSFSNDGERKSAVRRNLFWDSPGFHILDRVEMDHCADLHYGLNLWPQVYRILSETQKTSKYMYHLIINSYLNQVTFYKIGFEYVINTLHQIHIQLSWSYFIINVWF